MELKAGSEKELVEILILLEYIIFIKAFYCALSDTNLTENDETLPILISLWIQIAYVSDNFILRSINTLNGNILSFKMMELSFIN